MTSLPFLDGLVAENEILYRGASGWPAGQFRVILLNDTDAMTQNAGIIEILKKEPLVSDGYARSTWAPAAAAVKNTVSNEVAFASDITTITKPASPAVVIQYDCVALLAAAPATANRVVESSASNAFQVTGHGLVVDDRVFFTGASSYPSGIAADTLYYVAATSLTANQFRVAATAGGAALAVGSSFTGAMIARYANGVALRFEKIPVDGAGNNTRSLNPGGSLEVAVETGSR